MTNEQRISIERSLEKFKELRKTLGPDASVDQKRYLEEMISMGERALDSTVFRNRTTIEQTSPFSLSWQRVGEVFAGDDSGGYLDIGCIRFFGLGVIPWPQNQAHQSDAGAPLFDLQSEAH